VVREQDLGRAIRDEEGRVFYVVEDDEHGRYAARTRKGSDKDLERYRALQSKIATLEGEPKARTNAPAFDATGKKRRNPAGIFLLLVVLLAAAGAYVYLQHPEWLGLDSSAAGPADPANPDAPPADEPKPAEGVPQSMNEMRLQTLPVAHTPTTTTRPDAPRHTAIESTQRASNPSERTIAPATDDQQPDTDPRPIIVTASSQGSAAPRHGLVKSPPDNDYSEFHHTASGLRYHITHPTDGPSARAGNFVTVRYTAQTLDGEALIDDAEQSFVMMAGTAIRAFDEGLAGIREGEQVRLLVPRGHSADGQLPGIDRIPDEPFLLDVLVVSVQPGVTYVVETPGNADSQPIGPGDTVAVDYALRIEGQDRVIDSTAQHGRPMTVPLGQGMFIPGFEIGMIGMRAGETRLISIPPYLAYGEDGAGDMIPPNAVLSFRITVLGHATPDDPNK